MDKKENRDYPVWLKIIALCWMVFAYIAYYHNYIFR
jgi:hypothetical protein